MTKNPAVFTIILVSLAIFVLESLVVELSGLRVYGRSPLTALFSLEHTGDLTVIYRFATYGFIHGGFIHLFMNMLVLYFIGREIENSLGASLFAKFYVASMYLSGVFTFVIHYIIPHSTSVVVGASGAICALLILYWRMHPDARLLLFFVIPLPIRTAIILLVAFDVIGTVSPLFNTGLSHATHLGGFLCGWIYAKYGETISMWIIRLKQIIRERNERRERSRKEDRKRLYIEEVDPILKKISENGIDSISDIEKEILRRVGKIKK